MSIRSRIVQFFQKCTRRTKRDVLILWFARKHPATPWVAKALCVFTVAYALSPIDLIPDFIPVLGYLDDVLLLPLFIWLAIRLLPSNVVTDCTVQAEAWIANKTTKLKSYLGAVAIVIIWLGLLYLAWRGYTHFHPSKNQLP